MQPRVVLSVCRQPARQLHLQRNYGAARCARSRPELGATFAAVKRQWVSLPSGRHHSRKSTVRCQAVDSEAKSDLDPEAKSDIDSEGEAELGERLREAILDGDWDEVVDLIAAGALADVDVEEPTALHGWEAGEAGELDDVEQILQDLAHPNAGGWDGPPLFTALFASGWWSFLPERAIDMGYIRALVAAGADPDVNDPDMNIYDPIHFRGYTIMHVAALENAPHIIAILEEIGADTEVIEWCDGGQTPLHVAATNGNVEAVEALLNIGADVNARVGGPEWETEHNYGKADLGSTPLHMVALGIGSGGLTQPENEAGRAEVASILLAAGADISAKDAEGRTALEVARGDDVMAVLQAAAMKA